MTKQFKPPHQELFSSGKFQSPPISIIKDWMLEYGLSISDFSQIVGYSRRRMYRVLSGELSFGLEYSAVRLFLAWAGLEEPERFQPPEDDTQMRFQKFLKTKEISVSVFCSEYFGFTKSYFYSLRKKDPQKLESMILDVLFNNE